MSRNAPRSRFAAPSSVHDDGATNSRPRDGEISPADWYSTMAAPALASPPDEAGHVRIRRYTDTCAEMDQPALNENLLCMHLGGAKQVRRWQGGWTSVHDIESGALTVLPAGQSNRWETLGPIDFAHLTLNTALLEQIAIEEFDREPRDWELIDAIGVRNPYIERIFGRLLAATQERGAKGRLYPDSLLVVLTAALIGEYSTFPARAPTPKAFKTGGLAPWRLRRVIDYMVDMVGADISLADLTALTGLSRAQFFRAFKQSTGFSPHRYLVRLRLDRAQIMLDGTELSVGQIADAVGYSEGARFSALFRARFGVNPRLYRLSRS